VRRNPEGLAVVGQHRRWNWAEFQEVVARFAGVLRAEGVRDGDRVAILADNSDLFLAAFYAVPWAGGVLVPINTRLCGEEVAELVDHATPCLILFDEGRRALLRDCAAAAQHRSASLALEELDARIPHTAPAPETPRRGADPASIFFTGGTTGRSKGAVMTHDNHMFNSLMMWTELGADTTKARYLHAPPMFHVADALFVHAITLVGGRHVILPRFEPAQVVAAINEHAITDVILVPTMIAALLDELERKPDELKSLERMYYGAMPMPEATARRLMRVLPKLGPVQLYGQSEAGPVITLLRPEDHDLSDKTTHLRSAGTPLCGVEIAIHDPDGKECKAGEVGEIVARSGGVMPCYWNDPEQSASTLRDGWLHTGDGGYIAEDGFLYVVDRIKDMIISGGENIYSIEVERAISLHPAVHSCAVVGLPDPRWGERVHAAIVEKPGQSVSDEELVAHCRKHIAGYKVPRSIERRDALPISGPGKILKRQVRLEAIATQTER
jgi:long-chain acyl-CoA synthetase